VWWLVLEKEKPETTVQQSRVPHVLVVDDERAIADTLAMILRYAGYSTSVAYDGERAMEVSQLKVPDMLISDVVMPGMNGFELAIWFRQTHPNCNVLLFSGQTKTAELSQKAAAAGYSFELLAKPVPPAEILAHLSRLCPLPAAVPLPVVQPASDAPTAD
jgi:CheY-like chemotaxis protein